MYNSKKKKLRRKMSTKGAISRIFSGRKSKPCAYCGKRLTMATATFDHVKPLSKGGYDKTKNGVVACQSCNSRKGSMPPEIFRNFIKNNNAK